jgi:hypothetical protein
MELFFPAGLIVKIVFLVKFCHGLVAGNAKEKFVMKTTVMLSVVPFTLVFIDPTF